MRCSPIDAMVTDNRHQYAATGGRRLRDDFAQQGAARTEACCVWGQVQRNLRYDGMQYACVKPRHRHNQ